MIKAIETDTGTFVVAENNIWVPGIYKTAEVAKKAVQMTDEEIIQLLGPIYQADGLDRPVDHDDLFSALEAVKELRLQKYNGSFVEHNGE